MLNNPSGIAVTIESLTRERVKGELKRIEKGWFCVPLWLGVYSLSHFKRYKLFIAKMLCKYKPFNLLIIK
jgi:hypothetical protein